MVGSLQLQIPNPSWLSVSTKKKLVFGHFSGLRSLAWLVRMLWEQNIPPVRPLHRARG
jgi:hypothetical protein